MREVSAAQFQAAEVAWYRKYGHYAERIVLDGTGNDYVIGDDHWNRPGRPREYIEPTMLAALLTAGIANPRSGK